MSDTRNPATTKAAKCHSAMAGCGRFVVNRREGTVMGRTCKSWFLILLFYVVFFSLLVGFFSLMIYILMTVYIRDTAPYQTGEHSLLKTVAGIHVSPQVSVSTSLIVISTNPNDGLSLKYEVATSRLFQKAFGMGPSNASSCPSDGDQPSDISQFCRYSKVDLGPCIDPIGQMNVSQLCIFIRVNKIFGWLPDVLNISSSKDILLDCEGQNPGDVANLREPTYHPSFQDGSKSYGVISNKFFPFINQKGYVSPMVAVQFPNMKKNLAILVQCQIKNLRNAYKNVKFEVLVLDKKV